jgi:hypothetical protein
MKDQCRGSNRGVEAAHETPLAGDNLEKARRLRSALMKLSLIRDDSAINPCVSNRALDRVGVVFVDQGCPNRKLMGFGYVIKISIIR